MISGTTKNPNLTIKSPLIHHHHQDLFSPKLSPNFLSFTSNPSSPISLHSPPHQSGRFKTQATINDQVIMSETETNLSFYELLGISESGSFSEIKQAYKHLARKYHPDVSPPDRTEEYTKRFIQVQEAYETLSDPNTRALYDRDMARGLHLAFSSRKQEGLMEKNEWRNQWQCQVAGLKDKRMKKKNMSWAAQMRQKRFESEEN